MFSRRSIRGPTFVRSCLSEVSRANFALPMRVKTAESPAFSALRWLAGVCALLLVLVSAAGAAPANESVAVVTGPGAPELDRFAEGELCAYLEKLFGLHVRPATSIPAAARHVFLVGNPTTNPLVEKNSFPPVSD